MEEERELQQQQDPVQEEAVPKLEEEAVSQQEPVLQQEVEEETGSLSATAEEEVRAFHKKYPGVDLSRLLAPEHSFTRFARGKFGTVPLTEIYQDYQSVMEQARQETLQTTAVKRNRSTTAASTRAVGDYGLTDAQKELLAEWNRKNPRETMSPKEYAAFLKR